VAELPFAEGATVKAGDIIARFESTSRTAAMQAADMEIAQGLLKMDAAKRQVSQLTLLIERGLAPRVDLDLAKAELASAETTVAAARSTMASLRAAEARATIRAKFDGVVQQRWHYAGDTVLGNGNDPVIRIVDPTRVQITVDVPVTDLGQVMTGQRATVTPLGAPPLMATVTAVRPAATPDAGTAEVILAFASMPMPVPTAPGAPTGAAAPALAAGTAVLAEILIAEIPDALVIPTAAIQRAESLRFVLVAGIDNRVSRRDVRLGMATTQLTQVLEGLAVGEIVVTSALTELNEGDLVSFVRSGG
jgi:RND family efflux transporter MFP subunit